MSNSTQSSYQERMLNVLLYIQNHLDDNLSLEKLAEKAFFSPYHFHRIFSAYTGESVKSYIRRLRLIRAARDLTFSDKAIIRIAERAGYDTQQSFHRAFKEAFDKTPKAFRNESQADMTARVEETGFHKIKTESPQSHTVTIKTIEPFSVAFIRHTGPYGETLLQPWLKLIAEIGMSHLIDQDIKKISIFHDQTELTDNNKLRYDACITLDKALADLKPKGEIGIQTLCGGEYAVIRHYGPLDDIEKTYMYLFGIWLPNSGYEPADQPNFLLHQSVPFQTPPDQLETDIYLPIIRSKSS